MQTYNSKIIFKTPEDRQLIMNFLETEKKIWNYCSEAVFNKNPKSKFREVHDRLYYKMRRKFPESPSQLFIRVEKDVSATFQTIKSNKHEITKAPRKQNLSVRLDKRLYTFKKDFKIALTTCEHRIEVSLMLYPKIIEMFSKYSSCDPLLFVKDDVVYLSIPFESPSKIDIPNPKAVGVDLGINNLAVTSEGRIYSDKKYLKEKRRLRYLKRQISKSGTKSARQHKTRISHKEVNRSKNMCHNLTKKILTESKGNVIVIENLTKIKENTKKGKDFNNKQSQVPYYRIRKYLAYKAPLFGKRVETVNPANTSRIDSRTGKKDGVRWKGRYVGKDGKVLHSDYNGSVNIARRSKLPISCGHMSMIFGQGFVNSPIVCQSSGDAKALA